MEVARAVYVIWWVMLVIAVVVVLPVVLYLLHRLLGAARSIERYTSEALAAGLGIARHTSSISVLDRTVELGSALGSAASSVRRHSAAIEKALADRT